MDQVQMVPVQYSAPKEFHEACSALENIVAAVKSGKPLVEVAAAELTDLAKAIDGIEKVPAEQKAVQGPFFERAGHCTGKLVGTLLAPKVVPL